MSYEADMCRHISNKVCDRHLNNAHSCCKTSKPKARDRHELVKHGRADMHREAGFSQITVEPRTDKARDQRRADIFYVDRWCQPTVHYYTDDTIVHPLAKTYLQHEIKSAIAHRYALHAAEKKKDDIYTESLNAVRLHPAVLSGNRSICYRTCAFTSLGDMNTGAAKDINCATRYFKRKMERAALNQMRADGLTPDQLAARFRLKYRARMQFAIARGNSIIARAAGI